MFRFVSRLFKKPEPVKEAPKPVKRPAPAAPTMKPAESFLSVGQRAYHALNFSREDAQHEKAIQELAKHEPLIGAYVRRVYDKGQSRMFLKPRDDESSRSYADRLLAIAAKDTEVWRGVPEADWWDGNKVPRRVAEVLQEEKDRKTSHRRRSDAAGRIDKLIDETPDTPEPPSLKPR